jgi:hypothetical protein
MVLRSAHRATLLPIQRTQKSARMSRQDPAALSSRFARVAMEWLPLVQSVPTLARSVLLMAAMRASIWKLMPVLRMCAHAQMVLRIQRLRVFTTPNPVQAVLKDIPWLMANALSTPALVLVVSQQLVLIASVTELSDAPHAMHRTMK